MKQLILMCGAPGSGKSTLLRKINNKIKCKIVSRDDIRFTLTREDEDYFAHEKEVWKQYVQDAKTALAEYDTVFLDATHLNQASRTKILRALGDSLKEVSCSCLVMDTCLAVCLERNNKRKGRQRVPIESIRSMFNNFQMPTFEEGFEKIILHNENEEYQYKIKVKED